MRAPELELQVLEVDGEVTAEELLELIQHLELRRPFKLKSMSRRQVVVAAHASDGLRALEDAGIRLGTARIVFSKPFSARVWYYEEPTALTLSERAALYAAFLA